MPGPQVGLRSLLECIPARGAVRHLGAKRDIQILLPSSCSEDVMSPTSPGGSLRSGMLWPSDWEQMRDRLVSAW